MERIIFLVGNTLIYIAYTIYATISRKLWACSDTSFYVNEETRYGA